MKQTHLHSCDYTPAAEKTIEAIMAVLDSGRSVELPATGVSMFPTLRTGDIVKVEPLNKTESPVPGSVVVMFSDRGLVMHRLIKIILNNRDEIELITLGDALLVPDEAWRPEQCAGVAVSFRRKGKERIIRIIEPGAVHYKRNNRILRVVTKAERIVEKLKVLLHQSYSGES